MVGWKKWAAHSFRLGSALLRALKRRQNPERVFHDALPRHKTCASWINRLAFERFPYLQSRLHELVECPFYVETERKRSPGVCREISVFTRGTSPPSEPFTGNFGGCYLIIKKVLT